MKIGIITHYYKSKNYGGNLQAYALCRIIKNLGYTSEQIQYDRRLDGKFWGESKLSAIDFCKKASKKILRNIQTYFHNQKHKSVIKLLKMRNKAVYTFNQEFIPHSNIIFNKQTIASAAKQYSVLITGSDQVWHPSAVCEAYLLDFANGKEVFKFSYAASLATDILSSIQAQRYKKCFVDYQAISVREEQAVPLIQPIAKCKVEQVLDPTLLMTSDEWNEIASDRIIDEQYMFCYFLGGTHKHRRVASEFAEKHNLKIVTLPHLQGKYQKSDKSFGDIQLYDVSPKDFISLIKYAEYIITDSFHAAVFSLTYKKQFFVFERASGKSMGSRIYSLTSLFNATERFCDTDEKTSIRYIDSLKKINYDLPFQKYEELKSSSIAFLEQNLKKAECKFKDET